MQQQTNDPKSLSGRREFLKSAGAVAAGLYLTGTGSLVRAQEPATAAAAKPALLGGKAVRTQPFPSWPVWDNLDEKEVLDALNSGHWFRGAGTKVAGFEAAYAKLTGAKHCLATANGTNALLTSLSALDVGPGDEVMLPPYTFIATLNVVLLNYALPIFVDCDLDTFQIDAGKIEATVTDRTAVIMPVHLGGSVADMDAILAVAGKHKLSVVEDACQAHLAQWRGRKVGTLGATGCFSFQATKNLACGDGGALLTNDEALLEKCYAFHNNARPKAKAGYNFSFAGTRGTNARMTEFQGGLLLSQMTRLEQQCKTREQNAQYLTTMLREIPGVAPARMYEGCTRNAYHLYMFRYDAKQFADLPRDKFINALCAEGIPAFGGYTPFNTDPYFKDAISSRGYQKIYSKADIDRCLEHARCPVNDRLCKEAVWLTQNMLLGHRGDMDQIADAVRKMSAHAGELAKM
jgi:perosamine synthetase